MKYKRQRQSYWQDEKGINVSDDIHKGLANDKPTKNIELYDFYFELDTGLLKYWTGEEWKEIGEEEQPTFPEIFSCHATLSNDTEILEEQDIDFNDTLITITATQPGVTKCILNNFVTYPEGVQVYHNGEVVQEVEFTDNIELTANEETSYAINLVKEV